MYLQRTKKSTKTAFFHFQFMFFALFLQKNTPCFQSLFSRSSLALLSVAKEALLVGINNALEKEKMETETEAKMLTILHKTMKNEDFLHFLAEIFGHVKKKQYFCKLFRANCASCAYAYRISMEYFSNNH